MASTPRCGCEFQLRGTFVYGFLALVKLFEAGSIDYAEYKESLQRLASVGERKISVDQSVRDIHPLHTIL
jgi:hypothetical protein